MFDGLLSRKSLSVCRIFVENEAGALGAFRDHDGLGCQPFSRQRTDGNPGHSFGRSRQDGHRFFGVGRDGLALGPFADALDTA